MVKSKLIFDLTNRLIKLGLSEKQLGHCINLLIEQIRMTLSKGGRVEVRGFGSFCLHYQARRNAHNPKTGEKVIAPPRYRVHFKPGKELRNRVNLSKNIVGQNIRIKEEKPLIEAA